ncbi:AAA family ATPase [Microbacterium sp. NPDC056736]|uniref:AAA family ATPase n=1 Tax=Microbacterium sp. NPDC056736 TaxID=3345932 RepID=UPI00366B7BBE
MRGGLERWKRGVESRGVRQAIGYALKGICDAHLHHSPGVDALEAYSAASDSTVSRFIVANGVITSDELTAGGLRVWLTGHDPVTGEERGHQRLSPDADLLLDGTLNHPKSYSIAALLHPELATEFEALQDRLRARILLMWQSELNARRGHGGLIREEIIRIEVVELQHRRSRALDPHIHRHLWLNIKVLGADGKWSNLDSRVAMKLHTVVNAEGELAARTDPAWIAALARHGYALDDTGEIAELAGAVRPVSRRSAQIESNRACLIAEWSVVHGGSAPSVEVLQHIDRRAWAVARPNKPADLDELSWEARVRDEITAIDRSLTTPRAPIPFAATDLHTLDLDLLAAQAVADADERSTSCGGRFSSFDIRAGAIRALSRTGIVSERDRLDGVIGEITERASGAVYRLVADDPPAHVKAFMATETVCAKVRLAGRLDVLARPGRSLLPGELQRLAPNPEWSALDASQRVAACAIAGTDGLVTVTGPAGTGKTTMLRAAFAALTLQRRRLLVVAPTRKAASVASREVGAAASSVHALLSDHGYRWGTDAAGAKVWTRLRVGDVDPSTGVVYGGPTQYVMRSRDRIVVDEAGMVDLQTANVLVELAIEQGVGLAFVGDTHQALPVGHAGAMGSAIRHANAAVELDTVHRFHDPDYAALTLRLRDAGDRERALVVAAELAERGHVHRVEHHDAARERMIDAYFEWHARGKRVTLVSSTNAEADAINDAIQQRRVDQGELDVRVAAWGIGQQRILVGDAVQTRRNDRLTGVENRAQWIVRGIRDEYVSLVSVSDSGEVARVSTEYAREHLQLAYASTVHGVQGDTADASVVGPDVDAAGVYVGLTRGRLSNDAIVVARTDAAARDCLAESMQRGTPELTMQDAVRAAQAEVRRAARNREAAMGRGRLSGRRVRGAGSECRAHLPAMEKSSIVRSHAAYPALASALIS